MMGWGYYATKAGKGLLYVAIAISIIDVGAAAYSDYQGGQGFDRTIRAAATEVAGWGGMMYGGEIGAGLGADIGFEMAGPIGAAIGAPIGTVVLGTVGYYYGTSVIDNIYGAGPQGSADPCSFDFTSVSCHPGNATLLGKCKSGRYSFLPLPESLNS